MAAPIYTPTEAEVALSISVFVPVEADEPVRADGRPYRGRPRTFFPAMVRIEYTNSVEGIGGPEQQEQGWTFDARVTGPMVKADGKPGDTIVGRSYIDGEHSIPPWLQRIVDRFHPGAGVPGVAA
jgi:hypothetical protein